MAELTLKDESVIEIGQSVTKGFNDLVNSGKSVLINPAGQPLSSGGDTGSIEPEQTPVVSILESIRDGISSLVESFTDSLSFQKKNDKEAERAARVSADDVTPSGDGGGDSGGGFLAGAMEKFASLKQGASDLMGKGGFMGLLIKGGLIAGLLVLAKVLQKYGKQIAEAIAPVVDGLKKFFSAFKDDIGPLFSRALDIIKTAFSGIIDIFKGLFTGDASTFFGGVKKIFFDFPLKLVSYIGDAFFSLLENALAAFGIESQMVTDIKNFFRELPENITQMFKDIGAFFTETIPAKVEEIKTSIKTFFTESFDKIKNGVKDAFSAVGNFFSDLGDSVKSLVNSAIDALPLPKFLKEKLKFETKASKAAGDVVTETGIKAKYVDSDIVGMQRERASGGTGALMEEGFAEATGEKYGTAQITKSGTDGSDFAKGILTPEQFKEYNKLDTDGQLQYLKALSEDEQRRREMVMKLKQDKIDHDKKLAKMIEEGKALQPEFGGEIISPDDQLLQDDLAYAQRTKQMKEDSAAMANKETGKMNVVNNSGGSTSTNVSNNSITNMAESTNTSDGNLREALSA